MWGNERLGVLYCIKASARVPSCSTRIGTSWCNSDQEGPVEATRWQLTSMKPFAVCRSPLWFHLCLQLKHRHSHGSSATTSVTFSLLRGSPGPRWVYHRKHWLTRLWSITQNCRLINIVQETGLTMLSYNHEYNTEVWTPYYRICVCRLLSLILLAQENETQFLVNGF